MLNWFKLAQTKILYVTRGLPGSGKSTKAKQLPGVQPQNVFSSDDLISKDPIEYAKFFEDMSQKQNWQPIIDKHKENTNRVIQAMQKGISPIVLDNTNIEAWNCKKCVEQAIQYGYKVEFVDAGTGGLTVEELHKRNIHSVPKSQLQEMLDKYQKEGPLTLEKVLNSHSPYENI